MRTPPTSDSPRKNSMRSELTAVDRCWALPIVSACSSFLYSTPQMNSGIFFVLFMEKFGVSRESALWPKTIDSMMTNVMGFVIGFYQKRFSVYSIIMMGAFVCPLSVIFSGFVPNMAWMSVTMGFFYGASLGILSIGTSIYIVSYFEKYRGAATGITLLGVSLTGIVGPLVLPHLMLIYDLRGTLILTGGLMLNLVPLYLMLKMPRPSEQCFGEPSKKQRSLEKQAVIANYGTTEKEPGQSHLQSFTHLTCRNNDFSSNSGCHNGRICGDCEFDDTLSGTPGAALRSPLKSPTFLHGKNSDGITTQATRLLKTPRFYALSFSIVAAKFTFHLFNATIVDYARNKGMSLYSAAQLVTWSSVGCLCGNLVIPFVADKVGISRYTAATFSFAVAALSFIVMPHTGLFAAVSAATITNGIQQGCIRTLKPVLIADCLGIHHVAVSWGIMGVIALPFTFCEPLVVGMFRDKGGSYDNLYRMCGTIDLVAACVLFLQACVDARNEKRHEETLLDN
ncbi:monocarboxylate transporter 14-like [Haemaphysalis longicornis]